ncbi:uncharacterized protein BX664DRAFT_334866 [Halteromyces radiatus]|uniref:uncharacterized protein n=1 Tax=Halteromyces radiatus TaxID=101107 RepID=UPI00221EA570|nr:uncharacterized protein BX664DRAFT_334866 [Halteromyces radiatus]KAI8086080.1 hypothetical protein BX664DRAFT_334866 [Halteromyces radiatus]
MFQIILREGITGGFVGPTIKQMVEIRGDDTGASIVHANLKPATKTDYTTQTGQLAAEDIKNLTMSLKETLGQLPVEEPIGSEDIYGFDTSIAFFSDDGFQWQNGGPEGCGHQPSSIQASPEQKQAFQALIQSLIKAGQQYALQAQE